MKHGSERTLAAPGFPGLRDDSPDPAPVTEPRSPWDVSSNVYERDDAGETLETDEERWHDELFQHAPEDVWDWPEDPETVRAWGENRVRRLLVRLGGWAIIAAAAVSLCGIAWSAPGTAGEVAYWVTLGRFGDTCPSARVVGENKRAESAGSTLE